MSDAITREFLLAFWKIHILHHAEEQGVYGHWMLEELHRHGYRLSPGTLYPLLSKMRRDWLAWSVTDGFARRSRHAHARRASIGLRQPDPTFYKRCAAHSRNSSTKSLRRPLARRSGHLLEPPRDILPDASRANAAVEGVGRGA